MDNPGSDEADDAPQASDDAGERASGTAGEQSAEADSASADAPHSEVDKRPATNAHPQSAKAAQRASDDEAAARKSDHDGTPRESSDDGESGDEGDDSDEAALAAEAEQSAAYVEQEASGGTGPNRGAGEEVGPTAVVGRSLEINETPSVRRRRRWVPPLGPPEQFNRYVVPRSPRRRRRDWPALMIAIVVSAIVFVGCCIAGFAVYTTAGTP